MAVLALGVVGAGLGSAIGIGASAGWLGGVLLGNLLFGGGKGQNIEGPRLEDLSVQTSTYGAPMPLVYGTMRISGNVIWSTSIKETKSKKKVGGKGGKKSTQTTYSYSASFAVGLCVGPVSTVRRIWADTKVIYDATAGNTQSTQKYPGIVRIHLGGENEEPDSTMEMHLGVGNVPAYRGLCYLTFTDLQLKDFANRIPNISAEVVASGAMQVNAVMLPSAPQITYYGGFPDPVRGTLVVCTSTYIYKYDVVRNLLLTVRRLDQDPLEDYPGAIDEYSNLKGLDSQGYFYHATDAHGSTMRICKRHPETLALVAVTNHRFGFSLYGCVHRDKIFVHRRSLVYDLDLNLIADISDWLPGSDEAPMCDDPDGRYWKIYKTSARRLTYDPYLHQGIVEQWDISLWTGGYEVRTAFWDDFTGHLFFVVTYIDRLIKWHPEDGYAGHVDNVAVAAGYGYQADYNRPNNGQYWMIASAKATLVDIVAMRLEKTINLTPYNPTPTTHFGGCYDRFTHSAICMTMAGQIKFPLERYGNNAVSLSGAMSDICQKAGMAPTDLVLSGVAQSLRGYAVTRRMAAREALEPLLGAYFIDAVETDGVLKFIPRGGSPVAAIAYDDLGAMEGSGEPPVRIAEKRSQDVELPQRLDIVHVDPARDHQMNTQHAARITDAIATREKQTRQLSISLTADEAKRIAERTLYNAWVERSGYKLSLPPKYLRLDPSDIITVSMPEGDLKLRLNKTDFGGNNLIACDAVAEDQAVYVSNATGASPPVLNLPILLNSPINLFLLDVPMLRYEDDTIGLGYAFGMRDGSGGASLYRSPDQLTWEILGLGDDGPTYGWATNVLKPSISPWSWDETNKVTVAVGQGTLDSKTAAEVLEWANVGLIGDEIIQWKNAALLSSGTYELSGLLRGRRGTESSMHTHKLGERFVVLSPDGIFRVPLPQTEIGRVGHYRGVIDGGEWDDAVTNSFLFNAQSMRCFSPVKIKATRNMDSDLSITWVRRTRWYGEWVDGVDVPLFEVSENYEIDILSGTNVKRTMTTTTPAITYTAAQQIEDFGSVQGIVNVAIYQINAVVGRGNAGKASL